MQSDRNEHSINHEITVQTLARSFLKIDRAASIPSSSLLHGAGMVTPLCSTSTAPIQAQRRAIQIITGVQG